MTCYHPYKGFILGIRPNGKKDIKVCSYDTQYVYKNSSGLYVPCNIPYSNIGARHYPAFTDFDIIGCGQCIGCRIAKSRDWAARMMCELQSVPNRPACFLTLTYDDFNVPQSEYVDQQTGEILNSSTLVKADFQKFMKRLRYYYPDINIRYYACGEYGSQTYRPHYHAIIYGLDFSDDRQFLKLSRDGFPCYISEKLSKIWPYGFHMICEVTWNTCAYVARYVTKKATGLHKDFYNYLNIEPEFSVMSLKPALGKKYYDEHKNEIFENGELFFTTLKGAMKSKPPRYFEQLYEIEYPDKLQELKDQRIRAAELIQEQKLAKTSLSLPELLEVEEHNFIARTKKLKRGDLDELS